MRIIALDPGGTTGVCTLEFEFHPTPGPPEPDTSTFQWSHFQLSDGQHHSALWDVLQRNRPDVVIWERFMYQRRDLTAGATLNLDAREYIGVAKLFVQTFDPSPQGVEQTPAQRTIFTDDKLKKMRLYTAGAPHANDATRHLLYYLVVNQSMKWLLTPLRPEPS